MTKSDLAKLIKTINKGPISWDPRGSDEEYDAQEASEEAWKQIKELLALYVEPRLPR